MFTVKALWGLIDGIGTGFHTFPFSLFFSISTTCSSFHLLYLPHFLYSLNFHISLPFMCVFSCWILLTCVQYMCASSCGCRNMHVPVCVCVHERACFCVHVWPLALTFDWAAYQTGCALGAEFASRHRPCQLVESGVRGEVEEVALASNFLTQKLPPGRFPPFLLLLRPPPSLFPPYSAFLFNTHSPNPIDLSWRSKQAKCAVAAQRDQNRAFKSRFTSLADSIAMIRVQISHSKQDNIEAVYERQHKESVIQTNGLQGWGLWGLDT